MARSNNDTLDEKHRQEELDEAGRLQRDFLRPSRVTLPEQGRVPESKAWLDRLYTDERIVREKKPMVIDHLRSHGPRMVSIDAEPMAVIDGMSQTATFPEGFASPGVVARYTEGGFEDTLVATGLCEDDAGDAFAQALRDAVGLEHVSFGASGAEANEKAFALCHAAYPDRKRVVAFEGSFHGRTLLSLHASYNPKKRAPYEIPGAEVTYAPYPLWTEPGEEPPEPDNWLKRVHALDWPTGDALLEAEVASLRTVAAELDKGDVFALIVEPMQSEGGDRYSTARFHRALRVLTRRYDVPLVYDEVQTGFGLGGAVCWHTRFDLRDVGGGPDQPDAVTFAKRAQVGVVVSRFADPEAVRPHGASAVRGHVHLQRIDANDAERVQQTTRASLLKLAARFPDLVLRPRATGYALAFDLPSPAHLAQYLKQRFWRGVVVFGAGDRTVRYRLNRAFDQAAIDRLFDAVRATLKWLEANPEGEPPAWSDVPLSPRAAVKPTRNANLRFRVAAPEERDAVLDAFMAIEAKVYEPARRDTRQWLGKAFDDPAAIALVAEAEVEGAWVLVGGTLGCPLEHVSGPAGCDTDPMRQLNNSMYALSTALDPDWSGFGIGKTMKIRLVEEAARLRRPDGSARYQFMCGRMRVGATAAMSRINTALGANEVYRFENQYGSDATAVYYRMPLRAPVIVSQREAPVRDVDLGDVSAPLEHAPETLTELQRKGALFGPAVNKLTLVNYVTPAVVRAVEYIAALTPDHPHLFLTSSRDEAFDKSLRVLKHHRPGGVIAIGFEGGYVGHTSAAARSLSDPAVHRGGPAYFDFVRIPHPAVDLDASRAALATFAGRYDVLGLWAEPVQERTGRVVPESFWEDWPDVPLVSVDTANAYYRSERGALLPSSAKPDMRIWYGGGQIGFVHVRSAYWVPKPLTMVSTWDGDELSLIRAHHRLRALRELNEARGDELSQALDAALTGLDSRGLGALRVVRANNAQAMSDALSREGFRAPVLPHGSLLVAPPLDLSTTQLEALADTFKEFA